MKNITLAAIALSNRDYSSLQEKVAEACTWVEHAARAGAELAVLPEALNLYCGDGPGNPRASAWSEVVLDDWRAAANSLLQTAEKCRIAVTVPVIVRERDHLANVFYLVDENGEVRGRYQKMCPTQRELDEGVQPGTAALLEWHGIRIGGAICFDTLFPHVFAEQARLGAELFLVPSLWPGGDCLNHYAREHSTPVCLAYPAWSRIIDITGTDVASAGYRSETLRFGFGTPIALATVNLDRVTLFANGNQEKVVEIERRYGGDVRVVFDQKNCLFFLESLSNDLNVNDIVADNGLVPARAYFAQCGEMIREAAAAAETASGSHPSEEDAGVS